MRNLLILISASVMVLVPASALAFQRSTDKGAGNTEVTKDALICRRDSVIGSRAKKTRICKTRSQWASDGDQVRDRWKSDVLRSQGGTEPQ
jgi:hypothetical protein